MPTPLSPASALQPENFCVGKLGLASKADFSEVFLIDMGFARPVPTDAEEHHLDGFLGTPSFASERAFKGLRCTRACDMEGLGYCLLEIYMGESSWDLICPDPTQPVSTWAPNLLLLLLLHCCAVSQS